MNYGRYEDVIHMKKNSEDFKLFDGRTFRIVRTHPEELHVYEGRTSNSTFWQFSEKVVGVKKFDQVTLQKSFGKRSELFSPKQWPRTHPEEILVEILTIFSNIFGKKVKKMMKIDILLNLDVEVVAHSEVVQNTSKTPKLSISDHISSLKSELPPKNSSWKFWFFAFLRILRKTKSSH